MKVAGIATGMAAGTGIMEGMIRMAAMASTPIMGALASDAAAAAALAAAGAWAMGAATVPVAAVVAARAGGGGCSTGANCG